MATNKDFKVKNGITASGAIVGTSVNGITGLSSTVPVIDGTAAIGTATTAARADHVHPALSVSSVANLTGGLAMQVPFQSAPSTTTYSADLFYDDVNKQLQVASAATSSYPVVIGGQNSIWQPVGASSSLLLRSATGNAIRLYTDSSVGGVRAGDIRLLCGSSDTGTGGNIQLSPGLSGTAGLSGFIKMIGATGYLQAGMPSGVVTLDFAASGLFYSGSLTSNTTLTFNNMIDGSYWLEVTFRIDPSTPAYTITWPSSVTWMAGTAPVLTTTSTTFIKLVSTDGGVSYKGFTYGAAVTSGTVTAVSVTTANGVSGTVATNTSTPAITLTLGAITPTSVASTGAVSGSNLSGTNTGDETAATIKTKLGITTLSGSNTGDQTITLTGDVTGTGTGSFATTLANTAVTAGAYTSANITVDSKGRITAASNGSAGGVTTFNTRSGAVTLTSADVTTALTFTPYNATNPSGYVTSAGSVASATTATNQAGGAANQIQYNTAANTSSFIAAPTVANTYLQWNGSAFAWSALPFDIAQFINGKPLSSEILVKVIFPRAIAFPTNFSGSYAKCVTAPTAATSLNILKNGVSIGSVSFGAGATTGTFSVTSVTFAAADVLVITANGTVDATFADVAFMLTGA